MNKNPTIDAIRGVAIIAVILVHTSAIGVNAENNYIRYMNIVVGQLSGFAVPLFVMVSGYVLSIGNFEKINTIHRIKSFYFRRASRILIPYIIFSIIFTLLHLPFGHFWFFNLILYLYLVYPLLVQKWSNQTLIAIFLLLSAISTEYILYITNLAINPVFHPKYILYMWMGILLYRNEIKIFNIINRYEILLMILYTLLLFAQTLLTYFGSELSMYREIWSAISLLSITIALFGIFYMTFTYKGFFINKLNYIGTLSFGIYIIHILFLGGTKVLLSFVIQDNNVYYYLIVFISSMFFSIIFTEIFSRYRLGAYILSMPFKNYKAGNKNDK